MEEALLKFEALGPLFDRAVLIVPGLILAAAGLVVWLGGLRCSWFLAGAGAAVAGAAAGFLIFGEPVAMMVTSVVFGFAGMGLKRVFVALAAGGLVFGLVIGVFLAGSMGNIEAMGDVQIGNEGEVITASEAVEIVKVYVEYFLGVLREIFDEVSVRRYAIGMGAGAIVAVASFIFNSAAGAVFYSIVGTSMIFCGMGVLLLHKGAGPVSGVFDRGALCVMVFLMMAVFGAAVQWLLRPVKVKKSKVDDEEKSGEE